jgi:large conductance mechanosensitive channel
MLAWCRDTTMTSAAHRRITLRQSLSATSRIPVGDEMFQDFKAFIMRGSVVDLAVGIVIGASFTAIVTSLVDDLISPMANVFGSLDFSSWEIQIGQATLMPGNFLNALIAFLVIAAVVFFLIVRPLARMHRQREDEAEAAAAASPTEVELLIEIRDELRKRSTSDPAPTES